MRVKDRLCTIPDYVTSQFTYRQACGVCGVILTDSERATQHDPQLGRSRAARKLVTCT